MNRLSIAAFLLIVATVATASQPSPSVSPVVATLSFPSPTVLPGVPFDMTITLKNTSHVPVSVGMIARLTIKLPDGTVFAPTDQVLIDPEQMSNPDTFIQLAPGEIVERAIPWFPTSENWTAHSRYTAPGIYNISIELIAGFRSDEDPPVNYVGPTRTTVARLERAVAAGADEQLWQKMQATGDWSDDGFTRLKAGPELADEIIRSHPTSAYYPYAVLYRTRFGRDGIEPLLATAERFPSSPAYPYLIKHAAQSALSEAMGADWQHRDPKTADEYYTRAQELFQRALKTSSVAVRAGAERGHRLAADAQEKLHPMHK